MFGYMMDGPTTVFEIRHGQSTANIGRLIGGLDAVLTSLGKQQADQLNAYLLRKPITPKPTAVYCSSLPRALETAECVLPGLGITREELVVDDRLVEIKRGDWDGQDRDKVYNAGQKEKMNRLGMYAPAPNGESMSAVAERMIGFIHELDARRVNGQKIVAVLFGHGVAFKCLNQTLLGHYPHLTWKMGMDNTGITKLLFEPGMGWYMAYQNRVPHLDVGL